MSIVPFTGKLAGVLNRMLFGISGAAMVAMMAFVCIDVVLRYLGRPILGSNDIVSLLLVVLIAFAMGHTHALKRQTRITILITRFYSRTQAILETVTNCASFCLFCLLVWQICDLARRIWLSGEVSMTLGIPLHPFLFCVAIGCLLNALVIVLDVVQSIKKVVRR